MRLPADAVLLALAGDGPDGDWTDPGVAALRQSWRDAGLPAVLQGRMTPSAPGETVFPGLAVDPFSDGRLDAGLTAGGVTTLVLCGGRGAAAVATAAHAAIRRGYRVFVVADASAGPLRLSPTIRAVPLELAQQAARLAAAMRDLRRKHARASPC